MTNQTREGDNNHNDVLSPVCNNILEFEEVSPHHRDGEEASPFTEDDV
jgi:hypothetical protein